MNAQKIKLNDFKTVKVTNDKSEPTYSLADTKDQEDPLLNE